MNYLAVFKVFRYGDVVRERHFFSRFLWFAKLRLKFMFLIYAGFVGAVGDVVKFKVWQREEE